MTHRSFGALAPLLASISATLALAACGGGGASAPTGSGQGAPVATPAPAPPPPSAGGGQFSIGNSTLTLSAQPPFSYAVLGYRVQGADAGFGYTLDRSSVDIADRFGLRLAGPGDLRLTIDSLGEGRIVENGGGGYTPDGFVTQILGNALGGSTALGVLFGPQATPLRAAALLSYTSPPRPNRAFPYDITVFAYAVPAQSDKVPRSGIVRYVGLAEATALDLDFATGRVTGSLSITDGYVLTLSDGVLSMDRTAIAGRASTADGLRSGNFEARLVGPAGDEIMYRLVGQAGSLLEPEVGGLVRSAT